MGRTIKLLDFAGKCHISLAGSFKNIAVVENALSLLLTLDVTIFLASYQVYSLQFFSLKLMLAAPSREACL